MVGLNNEDASQLNDNEQIYDSWSDPSDISRLKYIFVAE